MKDIYYGTLIRGALEWLSPPLLTGYGPQFAENGFKMPFYRVSTDKKLVSNGFVGYSLR